MHAKQQMELTGWLAVSAETALGAFLSRDSVILEPYWTSSKIRLQRWNYALKTFEPVELNSASGYNPWPALETLIEEIVISEGATRLGAALICAFDEMHRQSEFTPLANSLYLSHMETRNRVVRIMLRSRAANEGMFDRFNRLRRTLEVWTDLLLSRFPIPGVAQRLAFDPHRERDYARDAKAGAVSDQLWLNDWRVALDRSWPEGTVNWVANPELNRRIMEGLFSCLRPDAFAAESLPLWVRDFWTHRAPEKVEYWLDRLDRLEA